MEVLDNKNTTPSTEERTTPPTVGPLGKVFIVCGKIILGIFLAGWLLTALGLLIGFVSLMAIGDIWAEYLALPLEGLSPVVFAGLICAICVLFMGVVADLGFSLIRSKRVNFKRLVVGGGIWLIFLLWLIFAAIRNVDEWVMWAQKSEAKIELWERNLDEWEDSFERQWKSALLSAEGNKTHITLHLDDLGDYLKLEALCEEFDELYRYDDYIMEFLFEGGEVVIDVEISVEGELITRHTTITTPSGVTNLSVSVNKHTNNCIDYNIHQENI